MNTELYQREHFLARIKSGYIRIKIGNKTIKEIIKDQNSSNNQSIDSAVTPITTGRKE